MPAPPVTACARCRKPLNAGAHFCGRCGTPVASLPVCLHCRQPLPPGAWNCPACGAAMGPAICGGCGAALRSGLRFCPACGAPASRQQRREVTAPQAPCPACGAPRSVMARFCPNCGAAAGSPRRRQRSGWAAAAAVAVVLLAAGGIWLALSQRGNPPGPTTTEDTGPIAPPVTLTHPNGARVEAPEGVFSRRSRPRIDLLDTVPPMGPLERRDPAVRVDATTLIAPPRAVTVDLPNGAAGDRAVVLAAGLSEWVRLPSTPITLADGKPGQRVTIDQAPVPWVLSVAAFPGSGPVPRGVVEGDSWEARQARVEQYYWTDRTKFAAAVDGLAAWSGDGRGRAGMAALTAPEPASVTLLKQARTAFRQATVHITAGRRAEAAGSYVQGLRLLQQARKAYKAADEPSTWDWVADPGLIPSLQPGTTNNLSLLQTIENYHAQLVPWGIELTLKLFDSGAIVPSMFDVRVLPYYGNLESTDVARTTSDKLPGLWDNARFTGVNAEYGSAARKMGIPEDKALRNEVVRFYSPRALAMTRSEYLAMLKDYWGYGAALMALGELAMLNPATATAAGTAWLVYEVAQPVLEAVWIDDYFDQARGKNHHWGMFLATGYEAANALGSWGFTENPFVLSEGYGGKFKDISGLYTEALLTYLIDRDELKWLDTLRSASGGTTGYRREPGRVWDSYAEVPPIMLAGNLWGPATTSPYHFQRMAHASMIWSLQFEKFTPGGSYDLHAAFPAGPEIAARLEPEWRAFERDSWLVWHDDPDPEDQVISFTMSKDGLQKLASAATLSVDDFLKKAKLEVRPVMGQAPAQAPLASSSHPEQRLLDFRSGSSDKFMDFIFRVHSTVQPPRTSVDIRDLLLADEQKAPVFTNQDRAWLQYEYRIVLDKQVLSTTTVTMDLTKAGSGWRRWNTAGKQWLDRSYTFDLKTAPQKFLAPGVWNLGKGFPNEVLLTEGEKGTLSGSYPNQFGYLMRLTFYPKACGEGGEGYICFEAIWQNPAPGVCNPWDVSMGGAAPADGKSYQAYYSEIYECDDGDPKRKGGASRGFEVKGTWLRPPGGSVDTSYPPQPTSTAPPVGTNPFAGYNPPVPTATSGR